MLVLASLALAALGLAPAAAPLHFEADVTAGNGDYVLVPFDVPAGTAEIQIDHTDGSDTDILDWGLWSPDGFRGWGGGLVDPAVVGADAASRGYLIGPMTPGTWTVVVGLAKLPTGTGHYAIDVTFRDTPTLTPRTRAPFDPVVLATGARWYKGDFHVHDTESGDAKASIADDLALARSRGLDFVELSDHNTVSQQGLAAAEQQGLTDLLVMRGIEVTTYHGHGNAMGVAGYVDHRVGLGGVTARTIIDAVRAQGGLFVVNHPTLDLGDVCIGCAWKEDDTPWDEVAAIEVQNGNLAVSGVLFTPSALALWDQELDAGYKIAAVGGSDDHTAGIGETQTGSPIGSPTTLVWADELSEAAIMDGVAHGRTEVLVRGPDDPVIDLTVHDPGTGEDVMIGGTVAGVSDIEVAVHVEGADPAAGQSLQIFRDGVKADSVPVDAASYDHTFHYPAVGGPERFRAELLEGGQAIVITSHVYVDGVAGGGGGCGCRTGRPGGGGLILAGLVTMALGRRRRRDQATRARARAIAA
jgi:MYXO-CTERM domain-containing protein